MTSILLSVTGAQAWATVTGPLTSGMVGIPITIECDTAWDGLTKNLVCRCSEWGSDSAEQRTILNVGETAVVAHEVMKTGMYLYLGIEGCSSDGKLVIPTTWARCGEIQYGANAGTEVPADPTLPVWEQLQAEIGQLKQDVVTREQMVGIMDSVQSATQAAAISAGRAEAAAKRAEEAGQNVTVDTSLTQSGQAADAKAVGDALGQKLDKTELDGAIDDALTQAKESGAFDGEDGAPGADGYTPVKGTDYFTPAEVQEIAEQAAGLVDVPEGSATGWQYVSEVETTEEVSKIALTIPAYATEVFAYAIIPGSETLTSSIRVAAWVADKVAMGSYELQLDAVKTDERHYCAFAGKYGEKIRMSHSIYAQYPATGQVLKHGGKWYNQAGDYFVMSVNYGASVMPVGTKLYLYAR